MKRNNSSIFFIFATGVMLELLYSMHAYFLWWVYDDPKLPFAIDLFVALLGVGYISANKIPIRITAKTTIPFVIIWILAAWNPSNFLWIVLRCPFTLFVLLLVDKETLRRLLRVWTMLYAIILLVSIIAWPLAFLGILPSYGIINFGDSDAYYYLNYGLCLINVNLVNFDVVRFCSVFLEPGHVSMIGAFTLYANRFDFRHGTTWVIFIVSLITLSVAGYVLIALGYVMFRIQQSSFNKSIVAFFCSVLLIGLVYLYAKSSNGGDNLVNTLIVERLEYDQEKGVTGNNRVFGNTEDVFNRFISSPDFLTGMSKSVFQKSIKDGTIGGAGYQLYLLECGLLGTLFALLGYFALTRKAIDKRFIKYFLLLYMIAFLQRAWPTSHIWLFLFVFATAVNPIGGKVKNIKEKRNIKLISERVH